MHPFVLCNPESFSASNLESPLAIFSGTANPALARAIAKEYGTQLGKVTLKRFSDGELYVKFEQAFAEKIFSSFNQPHLQAITSSNYY